MKDKITLKPFYNSSIPNDWEVIELGKLVDEKRPVSYGIVQTGEYVEGGIKCTDFIGTSKEDFRKKS